MSTFKAEEYETEERTVAGYPIRITSYRLGERYACKVDNVSPGATFARSQGDTRKEAVDSAVERATMKLEVTKRLSDAQRQLREATEMLSKL